MGILDRMFRRKSPPQTPQMPHGTSATVSDEQALARYRYLLRTAPPEAIEQAHAEAFAQLSPEQRNLVLRELRQELPASERAGAAVQADPQALARMATRAEMSHPGFLERTLGGRGMGMGGMFAGTLLSSVAGAFIGTAIAHQLLDGIHTGSEDMDRDLDSPPAEASHEASDADYGDVGDDFGGDFGDL